MLRQYGKDLVVETRGRGFYEITRLIAPLINVKTGLLALHLQHTSASLLIQENADPTVRRDFEEFFKQLVRDGDPMFEHDMEGDDDMPAHIRAALTATNLSIPIANGNMTLGTWQGIYVWEHRQMPHSRRVAVHIIGE